MTKTQLIQDIVRINRSATPEFLEQFEETELDRYLRRLLDLLDKSPQRRRQQSMTLAG